MLLPILKFLQIFLFLQKFFQKFAQTTTVGFPSFIFTQQIMNLVGVQNVIE